MTRKLKTPYREFLPPLSTDEYAALKASIKADGGVRDPVVIDEDGNILDGHSRYAIDGNAPTRIVKGLSEGEKQAFVFRSNFERRNLSKSQKAEALKKMKAIALLLKTSGKSQAQIGVLLGVARETVRNWLMPKGQVANTHKLPDSRTKVPVAAHPVITERVDAGEAQAQVAADFGVNQSAVSRIVTKEHKQEEAKQERKAAVKKLGNEIVGIHHGEFQKIGKVIKDASVDLIFTDPPYNEKAVPLYGDLAAFAKRILRPGGWCLAYSGQQFMPNVLGVMAEHLTYGWCFAIGHSGGDLRFRKYKVQNKWKPIIGFYKPPLNLWWDWFPDFVTGGKEKAEHEWQQAEGEAAHYIAALSPAKAIICDPFCGSGTTCAAAKRLKRQWIAFEADKDTAEKARVRINDI